VLLCCNKQKISALDSKGLHEMMMTKNNW